METAKIKKKSLTPEERKVLREKARKANALKRDRETYRARMGQKKLLRSKPPRTKNVSQHVFGGELADPTQYLKDITTGFLQIKHTEPATWRHLVKIAPEISLLTERIHTPKGGDAITPTIIIRGVSMAQVSEREYQEFINAINPVARRRYANIQGTRALVHYLAGQPVAAKTRDVRDPTKEVFYKAQIDAFFTQLHKGVPES